MIRQITLHGSLAKRYSPAPIQFWFNTAKEIPRVLDLVYPGAAKFIREHDEIGFFKEHQGEIIGIPVEELRMDLGDCENIHVFLSSKGAGAEVIAYMVAAGMSEAVAAAVVTTVISTAVSLAIGAVVQSFADTTPSKTETAVKAESTMFSGIKNIAQQGTRVPLVFGRFRGSTVTLNQIVKDTRVTTGKTDYISMTNISTATLNIFDNDYSKAAPVLQTFTVNGTTYNAGQIYSDSMFNLTCAANGLVTVTSKMNLYGSLSFVAYAIDNSISYGQNVNILMSQYIDNSVEDHG